MPATFTIDQGQRLVTSRAWGVLVADELRATQRSLREAPGFEPDFRQIYDLSAVTELGVTAASLRELARTSPFSRDARRAVVVSSAVAYGMVRLYEQVGDRNPEAFRIFSTAEEALRWLLDGDVQRVTARPAAPEPS